MNSLVFLRDFSLVGKTLALQAKYQEFKSPKFHPKSNKYMKHRNLKDSKKRQIVAKLELISLQQKISKRLSRQFLESIDINTHSFQLKNRCVLTSRSKGICSDFKLSRIKTRELGLNGLINGLKKVSW